MTARLLALCALLACQRTVPTHVIDAKLPTKVHVGDAVVTVEVAEQQDDIERGLMHRDSLAADHGMLFFMPREKDWAFWMHDALIPLDIIFITKDLTVAGVLPRMRPGNDRPRRIGATSLYVLEVNAGWAADHNVAPGTSVQFENLRP